jgi:hypothetical protein
MALTKVIGAGLGAVTQDGAATFNEGSADVDFRVESNGNANALIVDGEHSTVGINTAAVSNRTLKIEGEGNTGAILSLNESTRGGLVEFSAGSGTELYIGSELGILGSGNNNEFLIHTGVSALKIDRTGAITKPLQPAFFAHKNGTDQSNFATGGETIVWAAERFDNNADFDLTNNRFAAPVTGKYSLHLNVRFENLDTAAAYYILILSTSNQAYSFIVDPDYFDYDAEYYTMSFSVLADMDASDTANVLVNQYGGTAQTDIDGNQEYTNFSGYLVC